MVPDTEERVRALVEPLVTERGMELVELIVRPQGRQLLIRLLVDRSGGVTIQQCAHVNQQVGAALEPLIEASYTVEVSSPGLDRPLVNPRDYERALGENLVVQTVSPDGKVRESHGMLLAVQQGAIVLQMTAGNVTIPWHEIKGAKKAIRW